MPVPSQTRRQDRNALTPDPLSERVSRWIIMAMGLARSRQDEAKKRHDVPQVGVVSCEPTTHHFVSKVLPPPPHYPPDCRREPTAAVWFDVG